MTALRFPGYVILGWCSSSGSEWVVVLEPRPILLPEMKRRRL